MSRVGWRGRLSVVVLGVIVAGLALVGELPGAGRPAVARAAVARAADADCPWVGSSAPIADRVAQLLGAMSQAQKLELIGGVSSQYAGSTPAIPALCIPALTLEDGPAGVGDSSAGVTQLPAPVDLAASWDPSLAFGYGSVIGQEDRSKGVDVDLGPTENIVRDPRWGRAFESYGEDPYLTGAIGDGYIDGVQSTGVMAQVKHLAAYDEETGRDSPLLSNSVVSQRALQEIYLPPFADAVARAHVASVMCSYNEVNGTPACQNGYLMTQVLDDEFGFGGFVTSDWYATLSGAPAADAGLDMQMPDACYLSNGVQEGIASGQVPAPTLDDMAGRILGEMFRFGLIGRTQPTGTLSEVATTPAHRRTALIAAQEGSVLLKNAGQILPLSRSGLGSVAVIGADASSGAVTAGTGSANVLASSVVTPLAGITSALAGSGARVSYADGSDITAATQAARAAKVAVVFASIEEGEEDDLTSIDLPGNQNALIAAVAAANPNTIVVLNTGSAVTMPWLSAVRGVIEAWYPGQVDGTAIANLLLGRVDPSGKLPVTFPQSLAQVSDTSWPSLGTQDFSEGIDVGYRWFEARGETPLFPFGYGLSYTTFRLSRGRVATRTASGDLRVSVRVTDTGHRAGADVVELYVADPAAAGEPPRQLEGFERVSLAPGQRRTIVFRLVPRDLSAWTGRWTATAGRYGIDIGSSSASADLPIRLHTRLTRTVVSGAAVGVAPAVGSDSPLLAAQCPQDALLPNFNSLLSLGVVSTLSDLP